MLDQTLASTRTISVGERLIVAIARLQAARDEAVAAKAEFVAALAAADEERA